MNDGAGSAPSGRQVRRWTARRRRARAPLATADFLADLYNAALTVAIAVAMTLAGAQAFGADLTTLPESPGHARGLDPIWLVLLAALAASAGAIALAARLGPVSLGPTRAAWWLPLPVDRRGLLRPNAFVWPAVGAGLGCVIGAAVTLASAAPARGHVVAGTLAGGAVLSAVTLGVGLTQTDPARHRRLRHGADLVLGLGPVVVLALALLGLPAPIPRPEELGSVAVVASLTTLALVVRLDRRLDQLTDRSLRQGGAAAYGAFGATLSVDTRALSQALTARAERPERRSRTFGLVRRAPLRLAAPAALITADLLLVLRERRRPVQLLVAMCLPLLALAVAAPLPALVVVVFAAGAYLAAVTGAEGARRAEAAPMLDVLLPLGGRAVRLSRLLTPALAVTLWSVPMHLALAWRLAPEGLSAAPGWLLLGVLAAPAWAAGAVRGAYRPEQPIAGQLVHTPMGSFDPTVVLALLRGPDLALMCAVPALVAVAAGSVTVWLVLAQGIGAAIATLVVVLSARR